jgi:hypothetical protein
MMGSRLGLKALGMCALVLGMMAMWAGAARAEETGGKWTYLNPSTGLLKTFEGTLSEPTVTGELETSTVSVLHAKVLGGTSLLYECTSITVAGGKLQPGGTATGRFIFHGCELFLNGVLSKNCMPKAHGTQEGLIETTQLKAVMLLRKLADGTVDKIFTMEPTGSTSFAFVESTEACSIGQKVTVGGKTAFQVLNPAEHLVRHLVSVFAPLMHLWIISDTAEHSAQLLRSMEFFLTGSHQNFKWAGLWN